MRTISILLIIILAGQNLFSQDKAALRAVFLCESEEYSEAIRHFAAVPNLKTNAELLVLRGKCFLLSGKTQQAITDFSMANSLCPKQASLMLARAYAKLGNAQKAVEIITEHIKSKYRKPEKNIRYLIEFANIDKTPEWQAFIRSDLSKRYESEMAEAYFEMSLNNKEKAILILDNLIARNDRIHRAYYLKGKVLIATKDYHEAKKNFEKALSLNKNNNEYRIEYARACALEGDDSKAFAVFSELIIKQPYKANLYFERSKVAERLNLHDIALNDLQVFTDAAPKSIAAELMKGKIYAKNNNNFKAIRCFNAVLKETEPTESLFLARADAYVKTKTYKMAIHDYSMALDLVPNNGKTYYKRANIHFQIGDNEKACYDLGKALHFGYVKARIKIMQNCKP